ncbi:MAG: hypothetical protein HRT88_11970 [Lentisphaeraceae bacterium]|nr:hypothetical protein [Lentisphaeraceae bacterium]
MKITDCEIGPMPKDLFDEMPSIKVTFENGSTKTLFQFYPDEISFNKSEVIGKTEAEVRLLKQQKDTYFLKN